MIARSAGFSTTIVWGTPRNRRSWEAEAEVEVAKHPFLDLAQAHDLAARLSSLLSRWHDLDPVQRRSLAEVIAYFVDPADEEHDTLSPIGLVDDEERVAALEADLDRARAGA